jgi:hypothetical protein
LQSQASRILSFTIPKRLNPYGTSWVTATRFLTSRTPIVIPLTLLSPPTVPWYVWTVPQAYPKRRPQVRLYNTTSGHSRLLEGPTDTVVALDASAVLSLLATASKDHIVRIYRTQSWEYLLPKKTIRHQSRTLTALTAA